MNKHFITDSATPSPDTNIQGQFVKSWLSSCTSFAECDAGKFVYYKDGFSPVGCGTCVPVISSLLVEKSSVKIKDKGELIHKITCFGTMPNGVQNMCEIEGNSVCFVKSQDSEETTKDGLPVITLTRDYQISGGVVRSVINRETGAIRGQSKAGVTLGKLTANGQIFYTIEPQWSGNQNYISCIPEGTYFLKWNARQESAHKGASFDIWAEDKSGRILQGRTNILIHGGANIRWTEGCIVIGHSFVKPVNDNNGIATFNFKVEDRFNDAKNAVFMLRSIVGDEAILKITNGKTGEIRNNVK